MGNLPRLYRRKKRPPWGLRRSQSVTTSRCSSGGVRGCAPCLQGALAGPHTLKPQIPRTQSPESRAHKTHLHRGPSSNSFLPTSFALNARPTLLHRWRTLPRMPANRATRRASSRSPSSYLTAARSLAPNFWLLRRQSIGVQKTGVQQTAEHDHTSLCSPSRLLALQGYLAHKKESLSHSSTVGSWKLALSYERGIPIERDPCLF
jgi:hypothetical protein